MRQFIILLFVPILLSCGTKKTTTTNTTITTKAKNHVLPENLFGEWFDPSGNREYNGVLIDPNFIEYNYTAFMYNKISKTSDGKQYVFTGKNNSRQVVPFKIKALNDNTITLQRGNNPKITYIKRKLPEGGKRVSMSDVPQAIKGSWYTTNGENTLDFKISNKQFIFKGEDYKIDEVMHIQEPEMDQYRFVVSNGHKSWLFYFKNWNEKHVQIGYNLKKGEIYKSNKDYEVSSSSLPKTVFGEWFDPSGNREYNAVLIQPDFIEYNYTAFMFDSIAKLNDTDYQFTAGTNGRTLTGTLSILNENTINLQRGNNTNTTYIKQKLPLDATPVSLEEVPDQIKGSWHLMQDSNAVVFTITDSQFKFRDQEYKVDEIMHINDGMLEQYRFIVSKGKKTHMFYFKNWRDGRIQIGFNGRKGRFYAKDTKE